MSAINEITDKDVSLFEIAITQEPECNALDYYQQIATKSAIYPGHKGPFGLAYVALKLNGEAGEFAEHVGKAFRDDGYGQLTVSYHDERTSFKPLSVERREALLKEAGDVLWYLSAIANELGVPLSAIALQNLQKLNDRSKRNKLSGSGDNR